MGEDVTKTESYRLFTTKFPEIPFLVSQAIMKTLNHVFPLATREIAVVEQRNERLEKPIERFCTYVINEACGINLELAQKDNQMGWDSKGDHPDGVNHKIFAQVRNRQKVTNRETISVCKSAIETTEKVFIDGKKASLMFFANEYHSDMWWVDSQPHIMLFRVILIRNGGRECEIYPFNQSAVDFILTYGVRNGVFRDCVESIRRQKVANDENIRVRSERIAHDQNDLNSLVERNTVYAASLEFVGAHPPTKKIGGTIHEFFAPAPPPAPTPAPARSPTPEENDHSSRKRPLEAEEPPAPALRARPPAEPPRQARLTPAKTQTVPRPFCTVDGHRVELPEFVNKLTRNGRRDNVVRLQMTQKVGLGSKGKHNYTFAIVDIKDASDVRRLGDVMREVYAYRCSDEFRTPFLRFESQSGQKVWARKTLRARFRECLERRGPLESTIHFSQGVN